MVYDGIIGIIELNFSVWERRGKEGVWAELSSLFIHTDNMQMNLSADFRLGRNLTLVKPCITRLL